ncbi:MAG: hypothetical protein HC853_07715 [Anaerolineae bacterium]|nr:hypothetical protein [Anaerolineae bacterium]
MRPIVDRLEQEFAAQVKFVPVNIDTEEGQTLAKRYRIAGTPTLLITQPNGEVLFRRSGGTSYVLLKEAIDDALSRP